MAAGDLVPGAGVLGLPLGVGVDQLAELGFLGGFLFHDAGGLEAVVFAARDLEAVLDAEDHARCLARLFHAPGSVFLGHSQHALHGLEAQRIGEFALELELGQGHQAVGRAGVAGDEDQLAVGRALGAPFQVVGDLDRLAFLVGAEQGHVQVVARDR